MKTLEGDERQQQEDDEDRHREHARPRGPHVFLDVVAQQGPVAHQQGEGDDGRGGEEGEQDGGDQEGGEVVPAAGGRQTRRHPGDHVGQRRHEADGALLDLRQRQAEVAVRQVRVERDGVAEVVLRRLAAVQLLQPLGHAAERQVLQAPDVPFDAEPPDLAHRLVAAVRVAAGRRPLILGPQPLEAAGLFRPDGADIDDALAAGRLLARGRDGKQQDQCSERLPHAPGALLRVTYARRSS